MLAEATPLLQRVDEQVFVFLLVWGLLLELVLETELLLGPLSALVLEPALPSGLALEPEWDGGGIKASAETSLGQAAPAV